MIRARQALSFSTRIVLICLPIFFFGFLYCVPIQCFNVLTWLLLPFICNELRTNRALSLLNRISFVLTYSLNTNSLIAATHANIVHATIHTSTHLHIALIHS